MLKGIMLKSSVKGRRPYSSAMQDMKRYASFIATSDVADVLGNASAARRFIVADIRDGAVVDNQLNCPWKLLFVQALEEIGNGRRYYFTPEELQQIEAYNSTYNAMRPEVSRFLDVFEPMAFIEEGCRKMKLSDIVKTIGQRTGYTYSDKGFNYLGRWLTQESRSGRLRRTMSNGCPHYLLKLL